MSTLLAKTPNAHAGVCIAHGFERLELSGPFWHAFAAFKTCSHAFLLDSSVTSSECGRYSFMGKQPIAVFQARRLNPQSRPFDTAMEIQRFESAGGKKYGDPPQLERISGDALETLRNLLAEYAAPFGEEAKKRFPFLGGAVGFFGYEAGSWNGPDGSIKTQSESSIPDIHFALYERVLCHDHDSGETYISVVGRGNTDQAARRASEQAMGAIRESVTATQRTAQRTAQRGKAAPQSLRASPGVKETTTQECCFDEAGYCDAVQTVQEHIEAGDIYQACMTQRFQSDLGKHAPWNLYCHLRASNPAPFACYLHTPTFCVVSASPERYLAVDRTGWAESRPIKGTRPRGKTPQQDTALRQELIDSEKDRAENVMIVDLVRNDFGRVCRFGSINVSQLMQIESYATVFQMVSTVRGQLPEDRDGLDLVRATFPGGSMTGAPKIEAMKILDRLEPVRRGIYSGGIGYLDYAGAMDLNMVIRSFVIEEGVVSYHAGGGVVADSSPAAEYQESLDKVVALQRALDTLKQETTAKRSSE